MTRVAAASVSELPRTAWAAVSCVRAALACHLPLAGREPVVGVRLRPFDGSGDGLFGFILPTRLFGDEGGGGLGLGRATDRLDGHLLRAGGLGLPLPLVGREPVLRLRVRLFDCGGAGLFGFILPARLFGDERGSSLGLGRATVCCFRANSVELGDAHLLGCGAGASYLAGQRLFGLRAQSRYFQRPSRVGLPGLLCLAGCGLSLMLGFSQGLQEEPGEPHIHEIPDDGEVLPATL